MTEPANPILSDRHSAIAEIARLMQVHNLTIHDLATPEHDSKTSQLTRILSYVGGVLVLAGLCFFLSMQWDKLDSLLRVTLTFGPGLIALIIAIVASKEDRLTHVATPLFCMAALFQTSGLFVFLDEYTTGNNKTLAVLMVAGLMSAQFTALFAALRRPAILFFALAFGHFAFAALFDLMGIRERYAALTLGLSGLFIASSLARTPYGSITGFGFIVSGFTFASALFVVVNKTPMDIILIGVSALLIYASVYVRSRALLFVAVTSMLGYLGYYTDQYFKNIVGWPLALIVLGLIMIVASHYAVRLGSRFRAAT